MSTERIDIGDGSTLSKANLDMIDAVNSNDNAAIDRAVAAGATVNLVHTDLSERHDSTLLDKCIYSVEKWKRDSGMEDLKGAATIQHLRNLGAKTNLELLGVHFEAPSPPKTRHIAPQPGYLRPRIARPDF